METKANHLLIGSFVLLFAAGIFAFVIWLARVQVDRQFTYYQIYFTDSVFGLGVGSDVRFNGIRVGSVVDIAIDTADPSRVRVVVELDPKTPVRADSVATMELQGITGVSFVQISGGSAQAPMLAENRDGGMPVIPSQRSKFSELFQSAPDLLRSTSVLVERATEFFSEENQRNVADILADLRTVSGSLAAQEPSISRIITNFDRTSGDVASAAKSVREIADRFDGLAASAEETLSSATGMLDSVEQTVSTDVRGLLTDTRNAAVALQKLTNELQGMIAENRVPIRDITTDAASEFRRFVQDARILVQSLQRVAARLEEDPSQVLFGSRDARFKPEEPR